MFVWFQTWFERSFDKGLTEGWGDSGEFFLQSSIALLSFSAFMTKFLQHVVAPAKERLTERNKSVQDFKLLPGEETSEKKEANEQTDAIIRNTKRKSMKASRDYDRYIDIIIDEGKKKSVFWVFIAAGLLTVGAHYWLGPLVLMVLWPILWMYVASVLIERKASLRIKRALDKLAELQEDVEEGKKLLGTLGKLEDLQTSDVSNREAEEDCLWTTIKNLFWKALEYIFLSSEMRRGM